MSFLRCAQLGIVQKITFQNWSQNSYYIELKSYMFCFQATIQYILEFWHFGDQFGNFVPQLSNYLIFCITTHCFLQALIIKRNEIGDLG